MATSLSAYTLDVYYDGKVIGSLTLDQRTNLLRLEYGDDWRNGGFAISPGLPLNHPHKPEAAYNYLDNALPEGEARKLLSEFSGVSERNIYAQARMVGRDLSGAFTLSGDQAEKSQSHEPNFRPIKDNELIDRLEKKETSGLVVWDEKPRLSMAGVQDKINILVNESGQIGFGDGALCSTHILKFEKKICPNLVLNEFFCMKLSNAVGLPTAEVEFRRFGDHPSLLVKRFDRKFVHDAKRVMRRHVIDGCQALNLPRESKYERNLGDGRDVLHIREGASLEKLFAFCETMSSPIQSKFWLINWQLFNLMINNYDSHGKNVSLFFDRNNTRFTPAYDLVNIALFPQFTDTLSMAIGEEFVPGDILAYQLADFAVTCNIQRKLLSKLLIELADKVIAQLTGNVLVNHLEKAVYLSAADLQYFQMLGENILTRTEFLKSQAPEIPGVDIRSLL
ncbi:MAG: type II toxin-antitoxin system HipA family toxin [Gammaproteobacteria bacterium]|nr:type II toxin-antitoxin system HipA family toxin [Gammaproteobacteria bacterium]